jgi:hypothetical protein
LGRLRYGEVIAVNVNVPAVCACYAAVVADYGCHSTPTQTKPPHELFVVADEGIPSLLTTKRYCIFA